MFHRERSVKVHLNNADLPAAGIQVVDNLLCGIADRAHSYQYLCSIIRTIIIERLVIRTDPFVNHIHIFNDYVCRINICLVAGLPVLEEGLGLFCGA